MASGVSVFTSLCCVCLCLSCSKRLFWSHVSLASLCQEYKYCLSTGLVGSSCRRASVSRLSCSICACAVSTIIVMTAFYKYPSLLCALYLSLRLASLCFLRSCSRSLLLSLVIIMLCFLCSLQFHVEVGKSHKEIIVPVHDIQTDRHTDIQTKLQR